jgi:hypothetical protein
MIAEPAVPPDRPNIGLPVNSALGKEKTMTKGNQGQTCADAIKACFIGVTIPLPYSQIFAQVKKQGAWRDITIWRYLMSTVVNLIPARYEWRTTGKFLFLRPDGQYEIYDKAKHPKPIE